MNQKETKQVVDPKVSNEKMVVLKRSSKWWIKTAAVGGLLVGAGSGFGIGVITSQFLGQQQLSQAVQTGQNQGSLQNQQKQNGHSTQGNQQNGGLQNGGPQDGGPGQMPGNGNGGPQGNGPENGGMPPGESNKQGSSNQSSKKNTKKQTKDSDTSNTQSNKENTTNF